MIAVAAFVAVAGAATLVRWRVGVALRRPLGTLLVNVVGAFALGLLDGRTGPAVTVIAVGGLGALTTFSTVADELVGIGRSAPGRAAAYLLVTLAAGLAAAAAGTAIAG